MSLARRLKNKLGRTQLMLTGEKVGRLVSINVENAALIAQAYERVTTRTLIEEAGLSSLEPKHLPSDMLEALRPFFIECRTVLLDIFNPDFSFRNHLLHDPQLNVLFADTFTELEVLGLRRYAPKVSRRVKGTVAYLSNTWIDNYYHWMQLTLPLLRLYQKLAPEIEIDYYYTGESTLTRLQEETLARFGIQRERLLREPCRADRLLTAIYLHRPQHMGMRFRDVWGQEFVKSAFEIEAGVESSEELPRRIYVERGQAATRHTVNEDEVIAYVREFGFLPVRMDGRTLAEQARLFANAEMIIGTHGAALTNLIFAREGTLAIEIFPHGFQETSYFTAATHSKLDYYYLIGEATTDAAANFNLRVDLHKLGRLLRMAGVGGA